MPDVFTGERKEGFGLLDDIEGSVADALSVKDDLGLKKANVYFYRKEDDEEDATWKQILPTPSIKDFSHDVRLLEGGSVQQGDLILRGFPRSLYSESDLETATEEGTTTLYWVINDRPYTTVSIVKKMLTWNVQVRRVENAGKLIVPPPEEEVFRFSNIRRRLL